MPKKKSVARNSVQKKTKKKKTVRTAKKKAKVLRSKRVVQSDLTPVILPRPLDVPAEIPLPTLFRSRDQLRLLDKKANILTRVPMVPHSAIKRDPSGLRYAHTQAAQVVETYRNECIAERLDLSQTYVHTSPGKYDKLAMGAVEGGPTDCMVTHIVIEVTDRDSGEFRQFASTGQGDNGVWSANSSQTVAYKQALLMFFCAAWPQPDSMADLIKEDLGRLDDEQFAKTIVDIVPHDRQDVRQALLDFFGNFGT